MSNQAKQRAPRGAARRGSVLATAMWLVVALSAVVLVLCREMSVEGMVAKQQLSQAQADAAELGVEQFVMSVAAQEQETPGYKDQINYEGRQMGTSYFWILTLNLNDETLPAYGLTDEASKLDINTATESMLEFLPNMDVNLAAAIVDWRDADDTVTQASSGAIGAESSDYETLTIPYTAKDAPFEDINELFLVENMTPDIAWGADLNHDNRIEPWEAAQANAGTNFDSDTLLGIMSYVTVYGSRATNPPASQPASSTATTTNVLGAAPTTAATFTPIQADVNASPTAVNPTGAPALKDILDQYLPAKSAAIVGGMAAPRSTGPGPAPKAPTFIGLWDWIMQMNKNARVGLTSDDLQMIYPYITWNPKPPAANAATTTPVPIPMAQVNINTAPKSVLLCLPGFTEDDVDAIIAYRQANPETDPTQTPNIYWFLDIVTQSETLPASVKTNPNVTVTATPGVPAVAGATPENVGWGGMITGSSTVYSADIVTVSHDGRAFKRVQIVVDASTGTSQIVSRRDLTDSGWPLDPAIRESLRNGGGLVLDGNSGRSSNNPLSLGVR